MMYLLWAYCIVMTLIVVVGAIGKIVLKVGGRYEMVPKSVQLEELITVPFLAISIIAMYGYLQSQPIGFPLIWQIYFWLVLIQALASFAMPKQRAMKAKLSTGKYVAVNMFGLVTTLPLYWILYQYAFNQPTG